MAAVSKSLVAAIAVAVAGAACGPAHAQSIVHEIKGGVLYHDVPHLWSGFQIEPKSADINAELLFAPGIGLFGGTIRPAIGGAVNTEGATSHAYLDARWELEGPAGLFFGLGLGAAVHDGRIDPDRWDRKALGSHVLLHIPVEVGLRLDKHSSLSVYFEHTSNANTADFNEALDRLGVRYGWRF